LIAGGIGTWVGYQRAVEMRRTALASVNTDLAVEHFLLGMQAQDKKQYEFARAQYEYVIRIYPTFPGAADKLREVLTVMMLAQTPTVPMPTSGPTAAAAPDTRPQQEIYNQARMQYAAKDWDGLFQSIDSLRTVDPTFHAVEIDGMLYVALRARGIDKILHRADLEGGLYDLALAQKIGPLDVDSINYQAWARRYLNGTSFWGIDWLKVMAYFEEIYPAFPNLRDSSGLTAVERYQIAARSQGDKLVAAGDSCAAVEFYQKAMNAGASANDLQSTATAAVDVCENGDQPVEEVTPVETAAPTVDGALVTPTLDPAQQTPVETPSSEPVVVPSDTPSGSGG
jgi:tetratricopeptide (TPR) repeat protein